MFLVSLVCTPPPNINLRLALTIPFQIKIHNQVAKSSISTPTAFLSCIPLYRTATMPRRTNKEKEYKVKSILAISGVDLGPPQADENDNNGNAGNSHRRRTLRLPLRVLADWAEDPATGEPYPPNWEPLEHVSPDMLHDVVGELVALLADREAETEHLKEDIRRMRQAEMEKEKREEVCGKRKREEEDEEERKGSKKHFQQQGLQFPRTGKQENEEEPRTPSSSFSSWAAGFFNHKSRDDSPICDISTVVTARLEDTRKVLASLPYDDHLVAYRSHLEDEQRWLSKLLVISQDSPHDHASGRHPIGLKRQRSTYSEDGIDDADMINLSQDFESRQREEAQFSDPTVTDISQLESTSHHPWSSDVSNALRLRFRMAGFRENQSEAINATLSGKDTFVLMPTGGGKSLCYQLPAIIDSGNTRGVTIVVSPLLSLIHDQVGHLRALGILALPFHGALDARERAHALTLLRAAQVSLIYITPEMLNRSQVFMEALEYLNRNTGLARLVIDEAHCVSQWGHDFRPDYKNLGCFKTQFPNVPIMALTATATPNVIVDIKHNLGIDQCKVLCQSFNRPNIFYTVLNKEKGIIEMIANLIKSRFHDKSGIIYTLSRNSTERIAETLRDQHGIGAHHYHASMPVKDKAIVQDNWRDGRIQIVVATIAFGMGIDKPDVRFIIHHSIPRSLEGYYQETGRSGRDGGHSECYLFFNQGDVTLSRRMINEGDGSNEQKSRQHILLNKVVAFCLNQTDCRRVQILSYFGETFSRKDCSAKCDNCMRSQSIEMVDFTPFAMAILHLVKACGKLTSIQCAGFLRGERRTTNRKELQKYYGFASDVSKGNLDRIIRKLTAEGALQEVNIIHRKSGMAFQYFAVSISFSCEAQLLMTNSSQPSDQMLSFVSGERPLYLEADSTSSSKRGLLPHNLPIVSKYFTKQFK